MSKPDISPENVEEFRRQFLFRVEEIITEHGLFIQGVNKHGAYTLGISRNPEKRYEIIVPYLADGDAINEVFADGEACHGKVYVSKKYVIVQDGVERPSRFEVIDVKDAEPFSLLCAALALGWTSGRVPNINAEFARMIVFEDANFKLPSEDPSFDITEYAQDFMGYVTGP